MKPSESIIEYIRQHADEFDAFPGEILQIELWCYQELKALEDFKIENNIWAKITPHGSPHFPKDFKQKPVEDIEQEKAKQNHSKYSPQEQELIRQEEKQQNPKPNKPDELNLLALLNSFNSLSKFNTLTDKQKLAFILYKFGLNTRKSAKIMNISKSTYHKHLKSALKKLNRRTKLNPKNNKNY